MGQEIPSSNFSKHDFSVFSEHLRNETDLLSSYFKENRFATNHGICGFEVEAWLVDKHALPLPINEEFLELLNDPMVVHELAAFNVELNVKPQPLTGKVLEILHDELTLIWNKCRKTARQMDADIMAIGIHPGVREEQLSLQYMSNSQRYRALNEQVLVIRQGKPLILHIHGNDLLYTEKFDVMLEAGTTSFQIHLQVNQGKAVRAYNASQIASAPLVAVSANSPFIFEHALWDESRIPLFQQSVDIGDKYKKRVTFSNNYAQGSLMSCFEENIENYPVLIPFIFNETREKFPHLRFHNGTIWRWNRPLIGFDDDGKPHLRIENRVVPSGPTTIDMIANAAFYWGLVQALANLVNLPEDQIDFPVVRQNFYNAGRYSLESSVYWLDGQLHPVSNLLLHQLLPMAWEGLVQLEIDQEDCDKYMKIIESRIITKQNGARWQRKWVEKHGKNMNALSKAYLERQHAGIPVHEWDS
jgi:gamma-glutamyl:cysteine ligase YbdK (ATP-grasp superfamily)